MVVIVVLVLVRAIRFVYLLILVFVLFVSLIFCWFFMLLFCFNVVCCLVLQLCFVWLSVVWLFVAMLWFVFAACLCTCGCVVLAFCWLCLYGVDFGCVAWCCWLVVLVLVGVFLFSWFDYLFVFGLLLDALVRCFVLWLVVTLWLFMLLVGFGLSLLTF